MKLVRTAFGIYKHSTRAILGEERLAQEYRISGGSGTDIRPIEYHFPMPTVSNCLFPSQGVVSAVLCSLGCLASEAATIIRAIMKQTLYECLQSASH